VYNYEPIATDIYTVNTGLPVKNMKNILQYCIHVNSSGNTSIVRSNTAEDEFMKIHQDF
jgi:hypothetical protein